MTTLIANRLRLAGELADTLIAHGPALGLDLDDLANIADGPSDEAAAVRALAATLVYERRGQERRTPSRATWDAVAYALRERARLSRMTVDELFTGLS